MSVSNPANDIKRQLCYGMEGMWTKMFDPPTANPPTPDMLAPTNPVPEVMAAAGYQDDPQVTHTVQRDLLHGAKLPAFDGKEINFMLFRDADNDATGAGTFPGATIRLPRGVVFHSESSGHGPPPHTIHWHGIEPTPMNDGVGHCSMEIGNYTYQFQPNFVGFYFCHCHRNTPQHFEFGLYQALLIDPPDAFFATLADPTVPIGAGRDRKRRIAVNLLTTRGATLSNPDGTDNADPACGAGYEGGLLYPDLAAVQAAFPGFVTGNIEDPDPGPGPGDVNITFPVNPHAMTVPYDVEALWVVDDRDSRWSDQAPNARATYPKRGAHPGYDDDFAGNWGGSVGPNDFFSLNDFNPDYWYVTGVNFPGTRAQTAAVGTGIVVPPQLMSGVSGVRVDIEAQVGQTILVRVLDGAYNNITVTFPVDITIIAWDGRSLGVAPYNACNHPYVVKAGTPIHTSVARRFDALIKSDVEVHDFATIVFTDTRCGSENGFDRPPLFTGKIPINIGAGTGPVSGTINTGILGNVPLESVTLTITDGTETRTSLTGPDGKYSFAGLAAGAYTVTPTLAGYVFSPPSIPVTVPGSVPANFTAAQVPDTYAVSGAVVSSRGAALGIPRIIVTLSKTGSPDVLSVTDDKGHYHFSGLANGAYTVTPGPQITLNAWNPSDPITPTTPKSISYAFHPTKIDVTVNNGNQKLAFLRGRRLDMADPNHQG